MSDPDHEAVAIEPLPTSDADAAVSARPLEGPPLAGRRWHRDRLDFHFAVAVITENCLRARARADVPAGTPRLHRPEAVGHRKERRSLSQNPLPE